MSKNEKYRLIPSLISVLRIKHYSYSTEKTYVLWVKRFIRFHKMRHPKEMAEDEISSFLTHLAKNCNVAASTQNQALNAVVFLYRHVLKIELGDFSSFHRANKPKLLPVILSRDEVATVLSCLQVIPQLVVGLLYGCGLRLNEALCLGVKDIDFDRNQIFVRQGKGKKDRAVPLPLQIKEPLRDHIEKVRNLHIKDLSAGFGKTILPNALERKYPSASASFVWQFLFPASRISRDPRKRL